MTPLPLTVAFWNYDRTIPIADGRVPIEGCTTRCAILAPQDLFPRAFGAAEFDVSELSLSRYARSVATKTNQYLALPIFPSRAFRHASLYIRSDRRIQNPVDLRHRSIGLNNYDDTAAVVVRGLLRDEYGLDTQDITWVIGPLEHGGSPRPTLPPLQKKALIRFLEDGETLDDELAAGRLDGVIALTPPPCFRAGHEYVRRMFPDWREAEQNYFRRTRLFPIMHVLGVRASLLVAHPWLAKNVVAAFTRAKAMAYEDLANLQAMKCTLPWGPATFLETQTLMGEDYWPYGLEPNRAVLANFLRHLEEDGLLPRPLSPDDLFARADHVRGKTEGVQ